MQLPTILSILSLAALGAATPVAPASLEARAGSCNPEGKPLITALVDTYLAHMQIERKLCPNTSVIIGAYGCGDVHNPQEILLCTSTGLVLVATCAPGTQCKGINGQPYCVPV